MSENKNELRAKMREIAGTRDSATALSACLAQQLRQWPLWQSSAAVAAFSSLPGEPDVLDPWPQDKRIALPRISGAELTFHWVADFAELQPGQFGIMEPSEDAQEAGKEFDLILVPGLAFDLGGRRLGRGKGYYDRFLSTARGLRVGICYDDQIVDEVPVEPHDLKMDFVVTPSAIYRCGL
jgi:5-formyltetrahydrofolate cyclo-ligase